MTLKEKRDIVGFMDLEKVYVRINREDLWQVLRMYNLGDKLLSGIKSMYVDNLASVRVKEGESRWFKIDSGVSCPISISMYIWKQ